VQAYVGTESIRGPTTDCLYDLEVDPFLCKHGGSSRTKGMTGNVGEIKSLELGEEPSPPWSGSIAPYP
jgi:hypothetical protein